MMHNGTVFMIIDRISKNLSPLLLRVRHVSTLNSPRRRERFPFVSGKWNRIFGTIIIIKLEIHSITPPVPSHPILSDPCSPLRVPHAHAKICRYMHWRGSYWQTWEKLKPNNGYPLSCACLCRFLCWSMISWWSYDCDAWVKIPIYRTYIGSREGKKIWMGKMRGSIHTYTW